MHLVTMSVYSSAREAAERLWLLSRRRVAELECGQNAHAQRNREWKVNLLYVQIAENCERKWNVQKTFYATEKVQWLTIKRWKNLVETKTFHIIERWSLYLVTQCNSDYIKCFNTHTLTFYALCKQTLYATKLTGWPSAQPNTIGHKTG